MSVHIYHTHKLQCLCIILPPLCSCWVPRCYSSYGHLLMLMRSPSVSGAICHCLCCRPSKREMWDALLVKIWNMYWPPSYRGFIVMSLWLLLVVNDALMFVCYSIHNELSIINNGFVSRLPKVVLSLKYRHSKKNDVRTCSEFRYFVLLHRHIFYKGERR